ncbi:MAG: hypothetical protein OEZ01_04730 [Candidatus Heimdallarchaeota archaeon]|nr:hypothetical protein [Candidatus Heimdallarchaeota archaeon]
MLVFMLISPVLIISSYLARKGHWAKLIPALLTVAITPLTMTSPANLYLVMMVFIGYILLCTLLNHKDRVHTHVREIDRVFQRDIALWTVLFFIVFHSIRLGGDELLLFVTYLAMLLSSLYTNWVRKEFYASGIIILIFSVIISRSVDSLVVLYLSGISILSVSIFFIFQHLSIRDNSQPEVIYPTWFKPLAEVLSINIDITKTDIMRIKNFLPVLATLLLRIPSNFEFEFTYFVWYVLMAVISIILIEFSKFDIKSGTTLLVIFVIFDFGLPLTNTVQDAIILTIGYLIVMAYVTYRISSFNTENKNNLVYLGIFIACSAYIHTDKIGIYHPIVLFVFLSLSCLLMYFAMKMTQNQFSGVPVLMIFVIYSIENLVIQGFEFGFNFLIYLGIGLYGILVYRQTDTINQIKEIIISITFIINYILNPIKDSFNPLSGSLIGSLEFLIVLYIVIIMILLQLKVSNQSAKFITGLMVIIGAWTVSGTTLISPKLLFLSLLIFQLISKSRILKGEEQHQTTHFVIMLLISVFLFYNPMNLLALLCILLIISILSIDIDYLLDRADKGMVSLFFALMLLIISIGQSDISFVRIYYSVALLLICPLIILGTLDTHKDNSIIYYLSVSLSLMILFIHSLVLQHSYIKVDMLVAIISERQFIGINVLPVLISLSWVIWNVTSKNQKLFAIIAITCITLLLPVEIALLGVFTLFGNIILFFLRSFTELDKPDIVANIMFGISTIILGIKYGSSDSIWELLPSMTLTLQNSWIIIYIIWFVSSVISILGSGLVISIDDENPVIFQGVHNAFSFTWIVLSIGSAFWFNISGIYLMINLHIIFALLSVLLVIFSSKEKQITSSMLNLVVLAVSIYITLSGIFIFNISEQQIYGIKVSEIMVGLVLIPVTTGAFLLMRQNSNDTEVKLDSFVIFLSILGAIPLSFVIYLTFIYHGQGILVIPYLILLFGFIKVSMDNNDMVLAAISVIAFDYFVYSFGVFNKFLTLKFGSNNYDLIPSYLVVLIISSLLLITITSRDEIKRGTNKAHDTIIYISLFLILWIIVIIDPGYSSYYSLSVNRTIATLLFAIFGTLINIYGIKFAKKQIENIGLGVILLNILRVAFLFFGNLINGVETRLSLTLISAGTLTVMIFMVVGIKNLSQRENLGSIMKIFFEPIKKEVEQDE